MRTLTDSTLKNAVKEYGSPLYVFDLDAFHERFDYLKRQVGNEIKVNFCMKTNPFLTQVSVNDTDRIEVCSYGEFLICKELKISPSKLLISGVLKKEEDMRETIEYCKEEGVYTAESPNQVKVMQKIAKDLNLHINVYFRLNCGQFGMDEDTIISLLKSDEFSNINFYGIHYFTGTQKHKLRKHEKEINKLDEFFSRIEEETGKKVLNLEYGTGFGVPYFVDQEETVTTPENLYEFKNLLLNMKWKGNISLEMGRALAFNCGYYAVTIRDVKESAGKNYIICDGGIHQINYDGQLRGMYLPHLRVLKNREGSDVKKHYSLYGSLCTTNDVLVSDFETEEVDCGDIIVFERVGAYSVYEGMSLFLSHELPGIAFYSEEDGLQLVREKQESYRLNTPFMK
ncbi:MAG: hypothetical protein K5851_00930 [Lachnospiraceae bacterium]|nr:hypothetical protein [Lachnospiraceae bacterium]